MRTDLDVAFWAVDHEPRVGWWVSGYDVAGELVENGCCYRTRLEAYVACCEAEL